jgi:hypothetical protein
MNPEGRFNDILTITNVIGFAFVSSEDGSIMERGGKTPGKIDEMVAFIGSASEIIAQSCYIKDIKFIKIISSDNLVIIPYHNNYLGFIINRDRKNIENEIINKLIEEESKAGYLVNKLLNVKAKQLNMLIDEFSKDGDRVKWHDYVSKGATALSKNSSIKNFISIDDANIITKEASGLTSEEVNKFMKLLLDFIVKKAVNEYGNDEAKKRVHNVIKKMSENK